MYNSLNMFGIGNIFSGVCNTYTNYYGYGLGMGCCNSVFNYKGLMGLAIGGTIAPILGMITYKGISNAVANKQANSTSTLNGQINEILNKYNISDEKDMDKVVPDNSFDEEINAAKENSEACSTKVENLGQKVTECDKQVTKLKNALDNATIGSDEYSKIQSQLSTAETALEKAKTDHENAKIAKTEAEKAVKTAEAAKEQKIKDIEADKNTLNRLVEQRNEKLFDDADGESLFRTSKENLDNIILGDDGKLKDLSNIKVTKANLKSALHAYTKETDSTKKETYKEAFIKLYDSYDEKKCKMPIGSDLKAAYELLKSQSS